MTAQATAINVTGTGAVVAGPATLRGASIRDASGATNTVRLYDNASAASGTVVMTVQLAANASAALCPADGVRAATGLYLSATGAVEGSVWIG